MGGVGGSSEGKMEMTELEQQKYVKKINKVTWYPLALIPKPSNPSMVFLSSVLRIESTSPSTIAFERNSCKFSC